MNRVIISLKKEHNKIGRRMILMEEIIEEIMNGKYENISEFEFIFNETLKMIPDHEEKEMSLFQAISHLDSLRYPVEDLVLEHQIFKGHIKVIKNALDTSDNEKIRLALDNDCRIMFSRVRDHIHKEEKIFHKALFLHLMGQRKNLPA